MSIEDLRRETIPDPSSASSQAAELALRLAVETPSVVRMREAAGGTRAYIASLLQQERDGQPSPWGMYTTTESETAESQLQEFGDIAV